MSYYPFSELLVGSYFVFHPKHWGSRQYHVLFVKDSENSYINPALNTKFEIPIKYLHTTKISQITLPQDQRKAPSPL